MATGWCLYSRELVGRYQPHNYFFTHSLTSPPVLFLTSSTSCFLIFSWTENTQILSNRKWSWFSVNTSPCVLQRVYLMSNLCSASVPYPLCSGYLKENTNTSWSSTINNTFLTTYQTSSWKPGWIKVCVCASVRESDGEYQWRIGILHVAADQKRGRSMQH